MRETDDDMFGDRHDVRAGNFSDSDLLFVGAIRTCQIISSDVSDDLRVEINVVRTNTSGYG